ncbi:MAG: hypothetical protein D6796_06800 [Caldilineae bacterium]|nr:MAG: hypothetical protein D6796_06800 [Caldilineae bacterium]
MAKKKLSRDQKRKQKKRKRTRKSSVFGQRLVEQMRREGVDVKFAHNPRGVPKMSEVLQEFIAPYQHIPEDEEAMHKLIITAVVAWNVALMPESDRADYLARFAKTLPKEVREDFYNIVGELIERKEKYFARHNRMIIDYELVDLGDAYHIAVISTMPGQKL